MEDKEPIEVTEAYNQVIVGNLMNHVQFWTFIGFVLFFMYGVCRLTAAIPNWVNNLMGVGQ
jgi:hypothetical protein